MKTTLKWIGIVVAALIVIVISIPFLINVDQFRPTLQAELTKALGREVTLGNLKLRIWNGTVSADDLSVAEDPAFGKPAFLKAKSLHVGVELWPFLFSRKLMVTNLTLDEPEIVLMQTPAGDWNFSSLGAKSKPAAAASGSQPSSLDLSVNLIRVTNGTLTLRRTIGHWKPLTLEQVNIEVRDFSSTSVSPFSLTSKLRGGGSIQLDGKAGPINAQDTSLTPVTVSLNATQLDLARSGMNDFMPDLAGLVSFDANGESDGRTMHLKGRLKADQLKLARNGTADRQPVELDFALQHDLRKHAGTVQQGDIHIGKALAKLTGTYAEQNDLMVLDLKLAGPQMPLEELESLLPAMGVVLPNGASLKGGTASANLAFEGRADRLVTKGSLAVDNTRLAGFDLSKKMSLVEKLAGIKANPDTDIQTLSANVEASPDGIQAQDVKLVVPSIGDLNGNGTVSPSNALDFKMSAVVHATGILGGVSGQPIPFSVSGTCSDPVFRPDVKAIVKEEVKGEAGKAAGALINGLLGGKKKN